MVTELDLEIPDDVLELITEFGLDASFVVQSKTYDKTTGKTTYGAQPNEIVKATPPWPNDESFSRGQVATDGNAVTYLYSKGLPFTPVAGMQVVIDSLAWTITKVQRIKSGTLDAAWGLGIQR